jgi:hypothetical protein
MMTEHHGPRVGKAAWDSFSRRLPPYCHAYANELRHQRTPTDGNTQSGTRYSHNTHYGLTVQTSENEVGRPANEGPRRNAPRGARALGCYPSPMFFCGVSRACASCSGRAPPGALVAGLGTRPRNARKRRRRCGFSKHSAPPR